MLLGALRLKKTKRSAGMTVQDRGLENAQFKRGEYNFVHRLGC